MGMQPSEEELRATLEEPSPLLNLDVPRLITQSLASRPDARTAEWIVEAAADRARLSRWLFLRFDVLADANGTGEKGFEIGPGARFDIPIFNRNQGGVVRASAELEQALHNRDAIHNQIVQEVRTAAAQYIQAHSNYRILRQRVVPSLDEALRIAEKGFADGGADYLLVLLTTTQYLDAKWRHAGPTGGTQACACRVGTQRGPQPGERPGRTAAAAVHSTRGGRIMRIILLLAFIGILANAGCGRQAKSSKPKGESPAKVEKLPQETEIAGITLTPQAQQRLGITLAKVVIENVERDAHVRWRSGHPGGQVHCRVRSSCRDHCRSPEWHDPATGPACASG